ncbi:hypothetical protein VKT23_016976 [Stygiomarasmius scandens]|uniref:Mid2 domain-containing protein n=1 Tax=Marasmiellus scandens TaxID=2682957 RepID=A0ABR1IXT9_9AGAR
MRGLMAVYNRNSTPSNMRNYIKEYLGIQYNAVTQLATESNNNIYAGSWLGPPSSNFSASNQTSALSALIAAIPLTNDTLPDGTPSLDSKSSKNSGKLIGGIVGGISLVLIIVGIILFLYLRKKRHQIRQFRSSMTCNLLKDDSQEQPVRIKSNHVRSVHTQSSTRQANENGNYSNSSQPPRRNREKISTRDREFQRQRPSSSHSHSDIAAPDRNREASLDRRPTNIEDLRNNMTTAELVTILNERLQHGQWREDEMPPEYPESSRG